MACQTNKMACQTNKPTTVHFYFWVTWLIRMYLYITYQSRHLHSTRQYTTIHNNTDSFSQFIYLLRYKFFYVYLAIQKCAASFSHFIYLLRYEFSMYIWFFYEVQLFLQFAYLKNSLLLLHSLFISCSTLNTKSKGFLISNPIPNKTSTDTHYSHSLSGRHYFLRELIPPD